MKKIWRMYWIKLIIAVIGSAAIWLFITSTITNILIEEGSVQSRLESKGNIAN